MRRYPLRWDTAFGKWVGAFTVSRVVVDLRREGYPLTTGAVYHWVAGRAVPALPLAKALVRISQGQVSFDDIAAHKEQTRKGVVPHEDKRAG